MTAKTCWSIYFRGWLRPYCLVSSSLLYRRSKCADFTVNRRLHRGIRSCYVANEAGKGSELFSKTLYSANHLSANVHLQEKTGHGWL